MTSIGSECSAAPKPSSSGSLNVQLLSEECARRDAAAAATPSTTVIVGPNVLARYLCRRAPRPPGTPNISYTLHISPHRLHPAFYIQASSLSAKLIERRSYGMEDHGAEEATYGGYSENCYLRPWKSAAVRVAFFSALSLTRLPPSKWLCRIGTPTD